MRRGAKEIDFALKNNLSLQSVDNVYAIVHNDEEYRRVQVLDDLGKAKILYANNNRPTYGDIYTMIDQRSGDDDINIFANSDMTFDDSINLVRTLRVDEAICLTRYNVNKYKLPLKGKLEKHGHWTQDTWIIRGKPRVELINIDCKTGVQRCDNRIAYIFGHEAGYNVFNPSLDVRSYHIHKSNIRYYDMVDIVRGKIKPHDYEKHGIVPGKGAFVMPCKWK